MDAKTKLYAFLGSPSQHSTSPLMHNTAFKVLGINACYLAFDVNQQRLATAFNGLKECGLAGANISMPNKQAIIPLLDGISERAELSGAVNTVTRIGDKYYGDITDGEGFIQSIQEKGWDLTDRKIVMFGAGGAARALLVQFVLAGVKEISVFNRSIRRDFSDLIRRILAKYDLKINYYLLTEQKQLRADLQDAYLLVNTSGVGMEPLEGESLILDRGMLRKELKVADIIYNPPVTKLLKQARESSCETINGKLMVLYQGAGSFKIWTGQEMPIAEVKEEMGITE